MTIPPRRPLTLRDVSEASGVSEMTVSRVLRNKGDVSEATREKEPITPHWNWSGFSEPSASPPPRKV